MTNTDKPVFDPKKVGSLEYNRTLRSLLIDYTAADLLKIPGVYEAVSDELEPLVMASIKAKTESN